MIDYRSEWADAVRAAVDAEAQAAGVGPEGLPPVTAETPPNSELGDLAFPLFPFARALRKAPAAISQAIAARLSDASPQGTCAATGPYLNVRLPREPFTRDVLDRCRAEADAYGRSDSLAGVRITVEFSSPNTNKPLHLGHLRNDALGESVSRVLAACGATVRKVNLINDRGIHICKSMLAYREFGNGETPADRGVKGDRLVGDYYVRYNEWAREDPAVEARARQMLRDWEAGDEETVRLWRTMNDWVLEGIMETYRATGVSFDQLYFESETYAEGRSEVLRGLEKGVFHRAEDGSVWADLTEAGLDRKVLLRGDGTSVYVTQDIGTVLARQRDWPFDRMVYVVGNEQNYHFRVLFRVLEMLGYSWASQLHHLSYGMVNLPEGKMKSREGTVVDADDLIASLGELAKEEIRSKEREEAVGDLEATAASIAIGALHYYLLQVSPPKDMVFNPRESLSFTGNTGPYLQYMCARISSMLRKAADRGIDPARLEADRSALETAEEWELVKLIERFPSVVEVAACEYSPAGLAVHLYDVAKAFSGYYHDYPILTAPDERTRMARLELACAVQQVLRNGLSLLNIPFLEAM